MNCRTCGQPLIRCLYANSGTTRVIETCPVLTDERLHDHPHTVRVQSAAWVKYARIDRYTERRGI